MRLKSTLMALFVTPFLFSQVPPEKEKSLGFHFAVPIIHEKLPEGRDYRPHMLLIRYPVLDLLKKKKQGLFVYIEPQLGWVSFSPKTDLKYEFGANLGFQYQIPLGKKTFIIAAVGSGPHFITVDTDIQAKGFIFSDNFEAGFRRKFKKKNWDIHLKWRFRHISNAGLKEPNKGIDNWFLILGVSKTLSSKTQ